MVGGVPPAPAQAAPRHVPIFGLGSTWSANAITNWATNIQQSGIQVSYQADGSTQGRVQFRNGKSDFGVSEIPYGLRDVFAGTDDKGARASAYMPIVAGGTSFMYNLKIGGQRVTNLRLSGDVVAKIFTGVIKRWNDPAIKADNPGLNLPARNIVPVVRQDGSGTSAQLTLWMSKEYPAIWDAYCAQWGKPAPCGITSAYPFKANAGFVGATGSDGVAGAVKQDNAEGAITYVEYSYAINAKFPVVKLLNKAGYYVEPTAQNVAVALTAAQINQNANSPDYLTQILDGVYRFTDPRTYPLSSYSYMIIPLMEEYGFNTDKGLTLGDFAYYFLCEGQQQADVLGYSPLPKNLVEAGMAQVKRIPGAAPRGKAVESCNNPTFSRDGTNTLAKNAPQPSPCDKKGSAQSTTGTAGARQDTTVLPAARCVAGAGTGPGSLGGGTGAPGSAGPGASGAPGSPGAVDPVTGGVLGAAGTGSGGDPVAAVPVSLDGEGGWRLRHTMMLLAGLLLLGLVVGPPLLSNALRSRRHDDPWGQQ
jgi:phosphate ABC transporter phosphate-binding protein